MLIDHLLFRMDGLGFHSKPSAAPNGEIPENQCVPYK